MCGVLRRDWDGQQRLLEPVYTVIPVSRDRLPLAELGRRHRGQQGQEPAFQGPLTDLGLQHPPCRSHAAPQGFYLGGQSAQRLRGARSLGDGLRGPRRALRSSHTAPQPPSRKIIRESRTVHGTHPTNSERGLPRRPTSNRIH